MPLTAGGSFVFSDSRPTVQSRAAGYFFISHTQTFGDVANWTLQDDNAPSHHAAFVSQLKEHLELQALFLSSRSPDMNRIEHV